VVGQVGCGKSSLLSALLGETEKLDGKVYVKVCFSLLKKSKICEISDDVVLIVTSWQRFCSNSELLSTINSPPSENPPSGLGKFCGKFLTVVVQFFMFFVAIKIHVAMAGCHVS